MKKLNRIMCAAVLLASLFGFLFAGNVAEAGTVRVRIQQETVDQVQLEQKNGNIEVSVVVDRAHEQQTTAVSLKLKVNVEQGKEEVSFTFPDKLSSAVTGSRYQNGYLYLYVSDDTGIFDKTDKVVLGNLQVNAKNESEGLSATVSYVKGSFRTVNAAYGELSVSGAVDSGSVTVKQNGKQDSSGTSSDSSDDGKTNGTDDEKTDSDDTKGSTKKDKNGKSDKDDEETTTKNKQGKDKTDVDEDADTEEAKESADESKDEETLTGDDAGTGTTTVKASEKKKYAACAVAAVGALTLIGGGVYVWKKGPKK